MGNIPNIYFVILGGLATAYLTFLAAKGGLTNNRFSNYWRRLTQRGRIVFFLSLFLLITFCLQECNNQISNQNKDAVLERERDIRDSLITVGITAGIDSSTTQLFDNLSIAFAKQNLKIDTLPNTIITINNSFQEVRVLII